MVPRQTSIRLIFISVAHHFTTAWKDIYPCQIEEYHPWKNTRNLKSLYSILWVCPCAHTSRLTHVAVRRQLSGVSPFLPPCEGSVLLAVFAVLIYSTRPGPWPLGLFFYVYLASHHGNAGISEARHPIQLFMCVPGISIQLWEFQQQTLLPAESCLWPHKIFIHWPCTSLTSFCLLKAKILGPDGSCPVVTWLCLLLSMSIIWQCWNFSFQDTYLNWKETLILLLL